MSPDRSRRASVKYVCGTGPVLVIRTGTTTGTPAASRVDPPGRFAEIRIESKTSDAWNPWDTSVPGTGPRNWSVNVHAPGFGSRACTWNPSLWNPFPAPSASMLDSYDTTV